MSFVKSHKLVFFFGLILTAGPALAIDGAPFSTSATGVTFRASGGDMLVAVCTDRVVHVVASPTKEIPESKVPVAILPCSGARFKTTSDREHVLIRTASLTVEVDRKSLSVRFLNAGGHLILAEQPNGGRTITPVQVDSVPMYEVRQDFLLSVDEALYGLGQHQEGFLNARDIPLQLLQANTNIAIPFVISTKGYGVLWNNAALTDFNPTTRNIELDEKGKGTFRTDAAGEYGFLLKGNERSRLHLSVGDKKLIDITNMWVADSAGAKVQLDANTIYSVSAETGGKTELSARFPSNTMGFRSDASRAVDYYFLYGPQPSEVIARYRELTGAAPLLPLWAYGFWQCRERYSSQQQILDIAAEFRKRQIPVDVLVQDWQYWGKYGWNAMKFDERYYPDPAKMMAALHNDNLHLVISVWGKFGAQTDVAKEFVKDGLVLKSEAVTGEPGESKETESWADFFNPKAREAYWSELDQGLFKDGLDGWWLDASEPEGDPLKVDSTFLGPGRAVRDAYPLFETSAVYNGQRSADENKRVVILTRSAFAGQQRYGTINWSGDISANWDTLRRQIPAGLNFGMSGFAYWTTDVGGFFRPRDQYTSEAYHELLVRWFQFGAFSPIFRVHGYQSETEMWKYGPAVEAILRKYDVLRYRLLPYIYSDAWAVTNRGETMMMALPFIYPNDASVRDVSDEFIFGTSLLINPVTEPNVTTRKVTLPSGDDWYDFWSGQRFHGGQTIVTDASLERLPIFVKAGSIVPFGPDIQFASQTGDSMEFRIYGGRDADFQLYQDGGDGYGYERGEKATINFHWNDKTHELTIGDRSGAFPRMQSKLNFNFVLTRPGRGIGIESEKKSDDSVVYAGHRMAIRLKELD
jgi:alpha-D-xyloside xylohydrolase